ncbi:coilin isoform X2 [Drosophila gunungcola]|uniref:coilin isoform X2 n=1 Tax=Drosophila gunungcola TaxID=103775 RepID=UPI0022E1534D|nr:coilin isoform X2 [Drosophila gunungcola]
MHHSSMKVDLSNFFKDERRQSLVFIDATWQNIKDLQDHIQSLFNLKDISLLTTDGCFLAPRESIKVLKSAQGLKAFRFASHDKDTFVSPAPVKLSKKRKNRSDEEEVHISASTPIRHTKRSKNLGSPKKIAPGTNNVNAVEEEEDVEEAPGPSVDSRRSQIRTETTHVAVEDDSPKKGSAPSKNKSHPNSHRVPMESFDMTAAEKDIKETKKAKKKIHVTAHEEHSPIILKRFNNHLAVEDEAVKKATSSSKNKNHTKSPRIPAESFDLVAAEKEDKAPASTISSRCNVKGTKKSKKNTHAKTADIQEETLEQDEVLKNPFTFERSKNKSVPKSAEILSETSHLTAAEEETAPAVSTFKEPECFKNKSHLKSSKIIDYAVESEYEIPPRPSVLFRCPLMELDSNIARIFEFPVKKTKVQILETIILNGFDRNFLSQKKSKKEIAKPLSVDNEADQLPVNGKVSTSKIIKEVEDKDKPQSASLHVAAETTLPKDTTLPEDKTNAEVTFPGDTTEAEIEHPVNSTAAEVTLPDDTTKAELTLPDDSTVAEEIHPDDTTKDESTLPDDSTIAEVDTTDAEAPVPDDSTVAEEFHSVDKKDPTKTDATNTELMPDESLIDAKVKSEDIQVAPARVCADNFISDSDDDVMLVDDTNIDSDSDVEAIPDIIKDLMQSATPLTNLPARADTILFKLHNTKGVASSGTTGYLAGNCTYVNRRTKTITVETITCPPGIGRIMSQYVNALDDSAEELPSLSINLKHMIDAKIVVASVD